MGATKRKAASDEKAHKKFKSSTGTGEPRSSSRPNAAQPQLSEASSERKPVAKSLLIQEERAFPRGGASVLTPLEQRQIKAQADRDVLFELQSGVPADGEEVEEPKDHKSAAPKKKALKKHRNSGGDANSTSKSSLPIHGLSFRNLVIGTSVFGRVVGITSRDVALALPNNLTGYVPLTAISEQMNVRIGKMLNEDVQSSDEGDDVDPKMIFHIGQWLRATVTATMSDTSLDASKPKRRIELTLEPQMVNGGLDADNIVPHTMLQAAVRSVEDHGVIMDLGLADSRVKGFISKKELGPAFHSDDLQEGQVMLCLVTGIGSNRQVIKLSPDAGRFSALFGGKNAPFLGQAPTIDAFLVGTAVDLLITDSGNTGIIAKIMGMLDVTADLVHCTGNPGEDIKQIFKIGSKVKGRIIWAVPNDDGTRRIGVSLLEHILILPPPVSKLADNASARLRSQATGIDQRLRSSSILADAKVIYVVPGRGLFLQLPSLDGKQEDVSLAFANLSQLSDKPVETLGSDSGPYRLGSSHRARIISYNPIDKLYYVALQQSILDQKYLRLEDVAVGERVSATVLRLILGAKGVSGALVRLSDSVEAFIPEIHFSDTHLSHPEVRFKEGSNVKARVLHVDSEKRQLRLTAKKTLLENDDGLPIWKEYDKLQPGLESRGTIVKLLPAGAVLQFYGTVRAWLPASEMSETYVERPENHFRIGQTLKVRILSINAELEEMKVSARNEREFDAEQEATWSNTAGGDFVAGTVAEKTADSVTIELSNGLRGLIRLGQLTDAATEQAEAMLRKLHVGKKLSDMVVLSKLHRSRFLLITRKTSIIADAKQGTLIRGFADLEEGKQVHGFVRNITPDGLFIEFANEVVGFLPKAFLDAALLNKAAFGFVKDDSVECFVLRIESDASRFVLTMREPAKSSKNRDQTPAVVVNPVDTAVNLVTGWSFGSITKARIASVKSTQLNLRLADNVQGRVDISEVFDSWDEIENKKCPLQKFKSNETLQVKVLGIHDSKTHRFLPISHRQSTIPLFELSAKASRISDSSERGLTLNTLSSDETYIAFVNNHQTNYVWASISPNVRGRISFMDLSDDPGQLLNVAKHFPVGCAIRVRIKQLDIAEGKLDLSAKINSEDLRSINEIIPGSSLAGRITKITERLIIVELAENVIGTVSLVELSDDYDEISLSQYRKNDIVRVVVLSVDPHNKKIYLSMRPSKVLSSSLPVKDPQVSTHEQLSVGDMVRGFVHNIGDKAVYVQLGARIDAMVRITDLSDQYIKDWKSIVQVDQLVKGRVIFVDADAKQVRLSLKASQTDENYVVPTPLNDLHPGMIVTGKVRKVEDFGAFIDIDNTMPRVSGLCHRSEVASKRVEDVRTLYAPGDAVKAKILKVDLESRKISLGLKASYFVDLDGVSGNESDEESAGGVDVQLPDAVEMAEEDSDAFVIEGDNSDESASEMDGIVEGESMDIDQSDNGMAGLKSVGFDWSGNVPDDNAGAAISDSEFESSTKTKRKRRKGEIKEDLTGDLDKYGPRSVSDFERNLLGQPNDSQLWVQYMAFQLELSELEQAREVAERALRTIHIRETEEKANVWIAWLNLEVEYGSDEQVEEVFRNACQVQDPLEMHEKMASIYISSGRLDKADNIFEQMAGNKTFRASSDVWLNYANFLMDSLKSPERARALLSRALQSVPIGEHRQMTAKFAALEFHSSSGDAERGRTIFESLVTEWPKWTSGWDMFVDLEQSKLAQAFSTEAKEDAKDKARSLFQRMTAQKMKPRRAKFVFKRWLAFEDAHGDAKHSDKVKALARDYVEKQHREVE